MKKKLRDIGEEPDYRFSLANERTLLAYLRSALALMAAGIALRHFVDRPVEEFVGAVLVVAGMVVALLAYPRWRRVEIAMRTSGPMPYAQLPLIVIGVLAVAALILLFTSGA